MVVTENSNFAKALSYQTQGTLQGSCAAWGSAGRGLRLYDRFPTTLSPAGDNNCYGCLSENTLWGQPILTS